MNKKDLINSINKLTPEKIKSISNGYKKGNYKLYNFYIETSADEIVMVYCIVNKNNEFVIPPAYYFTNKDNLDKNMFGAEILNNNLAIISSLDNSEYYLIDLRNKDHILIKFNGYILAENNYLICITDNDCTIYNLKSRKVIGTFDSIDLFDKHMICYYLKQEIEIALKFDYKLRLKDDAAETKIGNKIIYPVIPKQILFNKNKMIEYVGNCLNTEFSRNYIEEYYLNESGKYIQ